MRVFLLAVICGLSLISSAWAANYDNPVDGILRTVTGDAIGVEIGSNVSKSPDLSPATGILNFQVNSNTGYRGFRQLTDLQAGDRVLVEYTEDPNSKMKKPVATMITQLGPETVTVPGETVVVQTPPVEVDTTEGVPKPQAGTIIGNAETTTSETTTSGPATTQTTTTTTTTVEPQANTTVNTADTVY